MTAAVQENSETSRLDTALDETIDEVNQGLLGLQKEDGTWLFELEADATIPAEYIFLEHYLDDIDDAVEAELADYLRGIQKEDGGWPLFYEGDADLSASVKAYYALKLVGDDPDAPHMKRAREKILSLGGAEKTNVFTRYALALFEQVPWRAVPVMPVELMLMPRWFPFNIARMSYWSRTVVAPLLVLAALKPHARNPRKADIRELFCTPPENIGNFQVNATGAWQGEVFLFLDRLLRALEPAFPGFLRRRAIAKSVEFFTERLNGEDGLGAIFPAMANTVMAMDALGYGRDHPDFKTALNSVRKLLTEPGNSPRYCQPCISPVWDTALASLALLETGQNEAGLPVKAGCEWLVSRQVLETRGDWAWKRPDLRSGGWAFQNRNDYYPDLDDTAVVAMALHRTDPDGYSEAISRAEEWIIGMQSKNGGWGAFDVDNTSYYLNHIPFADHGALLDPPTEDVTARCVAFLAQLGYRPDEPIIRKALDYLKEAQQADGSWYGRWGTNYIYGTWSVLCALNAAGLDMDEPWIRRAVDWLKSRQLSDGGWGEDGATYWDERRDEAKESTASQTAWALLALMAAGEVDSDEVKRGIDYLLSAPRDGARWEEPWYTAVGFPRVFYLRYHGYAAYFPLWALARYRNLKRSNARATSWGM